MIITIDFETYYAADYSLTKMSMAEYIRDPQFKVHGMGIAIGARPAEWITDGFKILAKLNSYDWDDVICIAHNAMFDGTILNHIYGIKPRHWIDTMFMARPFFDKVSLHFLSAKLGLPEKKLENLHQVKGKRDLSERELHILGEYCKTDVENTYALSSILHSQYPIPPKEMELISMLVKMYTEPELLVDEPMLKRFILQDEMAKERALLKLDVDGAELRSSEKFAQLLFNLGVEPPVKVSPTTGEFIYAFAKSDEGFKDLLSHDRAEVRALAEARLGEKSVASVTRAHRLLNIGSPFPPCYLYYGAHSGRTSGGDKTNAQNFERGGVLRDALMAPPGYKLVGRDASQIEARITAYLAGETALLQSFEDGDPYSEFASSVYGVPVSKETEPEKRFVGKTAILGLGYQCGPERFGSMLKASGHYLKPGHIIKVVRLYRNTYPRIVNQWWRLNDLISRIAAGDELEIYRGVRIVKDAIILPNDMPIRYPNLRLTENDDWIYDSRRGVAKLYGGKMFENIVQGLARIFATDVMLKIDKFWPVALFTHDEIVCIVPDAETQEAFDLLGRFLSTPPDFLPGIPLDSEGGIAVRYGDIK